LASAIPANAQVSHDMFSKPNHNMIPDVVVSNKVQVLAPIKKLQVTVFSLAGCPPCAKMEQEVESNDEYDFTFNKSPEQHPDWLYDFMAQKGWSFPVLYWKSQEGDWKASAWGGLNYFRTQYPSSNPASSTLEVAADFAPTPVEEINRVLSKLPRPTVGFVDFGCGDARWCVAAAKLWNCKVTGIEIDPGRAKIARERVYLAGLSHLITIIEGDATKVQVQADVGVAYLWPDVLQQLLPRLQRLKAFASYMHRPPGLPVTKDGDSWLYTQPIVTWSQSAVWQGYSYSQPVCDSPFCSMCNSIRRQLRSR